MEDHHLYFMVPNITMHSANAKQCTSFSLEYDLPLIFSHLSSTLEDGVSVAQVASLHSTPSKDRAKCFLKEDLKGLWTQLSGNVLPAFDRLHQGEGEPEKYSCVPLISNNALILILDIIGTRVRHCFDSAYNSLLLSQVWNLIWIRFYSLLKIICRLQSYHF